MSTDHEKLYLDLLLKAHHQASQDFDKLLLTLAAGALALSITFFDKIAPKPARSIGWAFEGWAILTLCLFLSLLSFATSRAGLSRRIAQPGGDSEKHKLNGWEKATTALNLSATVLLGAGITFLIIFARFNLRGRR